MKWIYKRAIKTVSLVDNLINMYNMNHDEIVLAFSFESMNKYENFCTGNNRNNRAVFNIFILKKS